MLCHRRECWETQRRPFCFVCCRRISRPCPFSPALEGDTYRSAPWLMQQLPLALCVKEQRDGPSPVKATSLDYLVAFECMWTSDFSFPKDYHFNGIRQPRELKKTSCYICSDCNNSFICKSTKTSKRKLHKRDFSSGLFFFPLLLFSDSGKMCFSTFFLETSVLHDLKPKKLTTNCSKHINEGIQAQTA